MNKLPSETISSIAHSDYSVSKVLRMLNHELKAIISRSPTFIHLIHLSIEKHQNILVSYKDILQGYVSIRTYDMAVGLSSLHWDKNIEDTHIHIQNQTNILCQLKQLSIQN